MQSHGAAANSRCRGLHSMKPADRMRLTGRFTVVGVALAVTEIEAFIISAILHAISYPVSPVLFGAFGAVTTILVGGWVRLDAEQAFKWADRHGFLVRDEDTSRVTAVRQNCPKPWLVALHLQLHPELMGLA